MYFLKRAIGILLSVTLIFTNTSIYSHPENLASNSLFKLWEKKGINPQEGLIIEARLRAIHNGIFKDRRSPEDLDVIDRETVQRYTDLKFLEKYPFIYNLISYTDNRIIGMRVDIYKQKDKQQLVLFYNPDNPPWDLLRKFGVITEEHKEFALRGFWITQVDTPPDSVRRALLLALVFLPFIPACVFNTSGLPTALDGGGIPDAGPTTDGGPQPINTIEQDIQIIVDNSNNPVTLLPNSTYTSSDTVQHLSPLPQFVRNNNAAFRYSGRNWHWLLSESDRTYIIDNGFTYVFNGREHKIKLIGQGEDRQVKTITFTPQISSMPNYTQPYRITITSELIHQLAQQVGLHLNSFDIFFENTAPAADFILNGLQKQYAVLSTTAEVTSDIISPQWEPFSSDEAEINTTPTPQGINLNFTITAGDNGRSIGIRILTKSGGIPLSNPDLQAAWKMDEVDLGTDSGPNGNILTNVNGVESAPGKHGNAAHFTAANQSYLVIPPEEQTGLYMTGDMTLSLWVYAENPVMPLVERWAGAAIFPFVINYVYFLENGQPGSFTGNSTIHIGEIPLNEWHHVVFVREGEEIKVYIDGNFAGSEVQTFPPAEEDLPLYIGWNGLDVHADGKIDELAIFDRALTPEEIQSLYNQIDSSNFLTPALSTLDFKARGNSPFILRLTDNTGQILDVFILGLDPVNWRSIIINIIEAQAVMNPSFNLGNVESVNILVKDNFLPEQEGDIFNGTIEIDGMIGIPPTTRHRYATDYHDEDLTRDDYSQLIRNIERANSELIEIRSNISVIGIKAWQDERGNNLLLENGLGFTVNNRIYSAFTTRDKGSNTIYIPHPDIIMSHLDIEDSYIKDRVSDAVKRRNNIILAHEIDEIKGLDHNEAVFNEFSDSINGLNYADIVTVLLETLTTRDIKVIDDTFHKQFIANLLIQGMFLDKEGNTYIRIIREIIDDRVDEASLRQLYSDILAEITELVSSYRFTHRRLSNKETNIPDTKLFKQPGFNELFNAIEEFQRTGTIYIDLAKFFVRNNSLTTKDEVVTINMEYLRLFASFINRLKGKNIKVIGIHDRRYTGTAVIEELISIIRQDFGLTSEEFQIQTSGVDFSHYLEFIGGLDKAKSTVSILTEDSWQAIRNRSTLKIIDTSMDGYNRVNSSGWEFYTAVKGLDYNTNEGFLRFIIDEVLQQLINQNIITKETADTLREEILRTGMGLIPTYYDPILYYKTIETQKALLIAA